MYKYNTNNLTMLNLTLTDPHDAYKDILSAVETLTTANTLTPKICV